MKQCRRHDHVQSSPQGEFHAEKTRRQANIESRFNGVEAQVADLAQHHDDVKSIGHGRPQLQNCHAEQIQRKGAGATQPELRSDFRV